MKTRREIIAGGIAALGLPFLSNAKPIRSMLGAEGVQGIQDSDDSISAASYVQDGLVAMWDGIENDGWGIHNDDSDVWVDLIGQQDMILSQYGSFSDNALICSGTGYAASRGILFKPYVYAEAVVEYASLERQNGNIVIWGEYEGMGNYSNSGDLFVYSDTLIQIGGQTVFYSKEKTDKSFLLQYSLPTTSDVFASLNGAFLNRYTKQDNWATRYGIGFFGGRGSGYSFRGKIKRIAMYSRIPTESEMIYNYDIDRLRFNLP